MARFTMEDMIESVVKQATVKLFDLLPVFIKQEIVTMYHITRQSEEVEWHNLLDSTSEKFMVITTQDRQVIFAGAWNIVNPQFINKKLISNIFIGTNIEVTYNEFLSKYKKLYSKYEAIDGPVSEFSLEKYLKYYFSPTKLFSDATAQEVYDVCNVFGWKTYWLKPDEAYTDKMQKRIVDREVSELNIDEQNMKVIREYLRGKLPELRTLYSRMKVMFGDTSIMSGYLENFIKYIVSGDVKILYYFFENRIELLPESPEFKKNLYKMISYFYKEVIDSFNPISSSRPKNQNSKYLTWFLETFK